jgi:isocitrate dehydrogenase
MTEIGGLMMDKIKMTTPLVEMDGDEMTRILWKIIKDELLLPYIDLKTEYYDLGLEHRNETDDKVTIESAEATKKYGVAVKCATITPNAARMTEYDLKEMWKSPNGTIRAALDGTVFRAPIQVKGIAPCVKNWEKPITLARHAYGDVYKNTEIKVPGAGKAELVFTGEDGKEIRKTIQEFTGPGIIQGIHNTDKSITSFAKACFNYALDTKQDLWFATKDTISKIYDHNFKDIFNDIYEAEYKDKFEAAGIEYFYTLIDDAVARVMKAKGGFIWACKNYDGDVMSDMVSSACGSLAMMTSVLVSPTGVYEYEAAHGTVQRHYYKHLKGEETSTNSVATIFAWSGALRKRGELDNIPELMTFADKLEKATLGTIESGKMTKDLALITTLEDVTVLNSQDFIKAIRENLDKELA